MDLSKNLWERCDGKCELCGSSDALTTHIVSPRQGNSIEEQIAICEKCTTQIENPDDLDINHWRCLNESIWNPNHAVQVSAYRMLQNLNSEGWAQDLIGMMYMDEDTLSWAHEGTKVVEEKVVHKDTNGNILDNGDSVVLIKDLNVKGANFVAKRGTAVRRIRLVYDNAAHIEGKIDGQQIVILTEFVKKS